MSTEEPAWKAELRGSLEALIEWAFEKGPGLTPVGLDLIVDHIQAAEQRGREAAWNAIHCGACGERAGWIDCPTGGWWAHEVHPTDGHDAVPYVHSEPE